VLAQETDIICLDEPVNHLDMAHQIDCLDLVGRLNREHGRTMRRLMARLAPYRRVETHHFADVASERDALAALVRADARAPLARALGRYHRRRIAATPGILALLLGNG